MTTKQIADVLNSVFAETIGEENQFTENLSNFVDIADKLGDSISLTDTKYMEGIFKQLIDRIGKTIIESKSYKGQDWGIMKDSWEFGSILQKIRVETGEFHDNEVWDLDNYTPTVWDYEAPGDVTVKYVNGNKTFEAKLCTMTKQLKEAFASAGKMNEFLSALETRVKTKMEFSKEQLARRTIVGLIAEKIKSGNNVIDVAAAYQTATGKTITLDKAPYDRDFLEFLARTMETYSKYLQEFSQMYNDDEYATFTSAADTHVILQTEFANGLATTLPANTWNESFLQAPGYRTINYWQSPKAQGKSELQARTAINCMPVSGPGTAGKNTITCGNGVGIVGVMFDDSAAMICNQEPYVDSIYNPEGRFYKTWYRYDAEYVIDPGENAIVFTIGTPSFTKVDA